MSACDLEAPGAAWEVLMQTPGLTGPIAAGTNFANAVIDGDVGTLSEDAYGFGTAMANGAKNAVTSAFSDPQGAAKNAVSKAAGFFTGFGGRENVKTVSINVLNSIVSDVSTTFSQECTGNIDQGQSMDFTCTGPDQINGPGCANISALIVEYRTRAEQLRVAAATIAGPSSDTAIDTCVQGTECYEVVVNSDVDQYACTSCIIGNVSQIQHFEFEGECASDVNLVNNMETTLRTNIDQLLKQQQDITGVASSIFSTGSLNCMAADLTQRILNRFDQNAANQLLSNISVMQSINVVGESIYMQNIEQTTNANTVASLMNRLDITNDLYTTSEIAAAQELISRNASLVDAAEALSNLIVSSTDVIGSVVQNVVSVALLIAGTMLVLFVAFKVFQPDYLKEFLDDIKPPSNSK